MRNHNFVPDSAAVFLNIEDITSRLQQDVGLLLLSASGQALLFLFRICYYVLVNVYLLTLSTGGLTVCRGIPDSAHASTWNRLFRASERVCGIRDR